MFAKRNLWREKCMCCGSLKLRDIEQCQVCGTTRQEGDETLEGSEESACGEDEVVVCWVWGSLKNATNFSTVNRKPLQSANRAVVMKLAANSTKSQRPFQARSEAAS